MLKQCTLIRQGHSFMLFVQIYNQLSVVHDEIVEPSCPQRVKFLLASG